MQKFFGLLPAIHEKEHQLLQNEERADTPERSANAQLRLSSYQSEVKALMRFVMVGQASIARIMSHKRVVPDQEVSIKMYLDSMYEMDKIAEGVDEAMNDADPTVGVRAIDPEETITRRELEGANPETHNNSSNSGNKRPRTGKKGAFGDKAKTTFNNSVSLALLQVPQFHQYFGPSRNHHEGGMEGEKKIKDTKPLMGMQRKNAAWQLIAMERYQQHQELQKLQDKRLGLSDSRELEGAMKVYKSEAEFYEAYTNCQPLSALVDSEDIIWVACRPTGQTNSRSAIRLLRLNLQDEQGELVLGLCWCAPISYDRQQDPVVYQSRKEVHQIAVQYVLLLPRLGEKGANYCNNYYAIGSNWTERVGSGKFVAPVINEKLFLDWLPAVEDSSNHPGGANCDDRGNEDS